MCVSAECPGRDLVLLGLNALPSFKASAQTDRQHQSGGWCVGSPDLRFYYQVGTSLVVKSH